jgi:hypothetical protein
MRSSASCQYYFETVNKSGSSPKELAMREGFKGSRFQGVKGNAEELQRA